MANDEPSTRQKILDATRHQIASEGLGTLTIQGVADAVGVTKQAVLYWFSSKSLLMKESFFEALKAESDALVEAIERADGAADAIEYFLREGYRHHREHMGQFRLMYLAAQTDTDLHDLMEPEDLEERVYPVTSRFYDALEAKLTADPGFPDGVNARNFAVSLHMSLIGHACMRGSMDAVGEEFRQSFEEMIDAMVGVISHSLS